MNREAHISKDQVYEILVEEILNHDLKPGEALAERSLALRFGLSRTPIREVLQRLQSEQLVEMYPNQGAFVRRLTIRDVRDLFQMREALEPYATALAAELRPDDEINSLSLRVPSDEQAVPLDPTELTSIGEELHDSIARWARNDLFSEFYVILRARTRLIRAMTKFRRDVEVTSLAEHREIVKLIQENDSEGAKKRMAEHIRRSRESVMHLLLDY